MKYQIVFGLKIPNYVSERLNPPLTRSEPFPALPCPFFSYPPNWPHYAAFVILTRLRKLFQKS